jgi:SAM-dependent methyltransferase
MADPEHIYDRIGRGYSANRRPDPRVAVTIQNALRGAGIILNVGAGSGSYEPAQAKVFAVEPSWEMIRQRPDGAAPAVRALAQELPFGGNSFDASIAVLTVHHWADPAQGLRELMRVSRHRLVIFTWDPDCRGFWLSRDYFPELDMVHAEMFPKLGDYEKAMGEIAITQVPIPHDCTDGFLGAYWRRPLGKAQRGHPAPGQSGPGISTDC